jgi:hypothetical protein
MNVTNSFVTENITYISPLGLGFTALMCLLLLILPRKYALVPVIVLTCYMTMGERVMVADLNFTMIRILMLFGWVRILIRREFESVKLNPIDKALIWFVISSVVTNVLLWQTYDALKGRMGMAYNVIGIYFLFRFLLRDIDDCVNAIKIVALFIIPLAGFMMVEKISGQNPFAMFGGVPPITASRDGALRCQGPFAHPILAGTFGATLFPLFMGLFRQDKGNRVLSILAMLSCGAIVLVSASSGPLFAFLSGLLALALWPLREHMRVIRWGIVLTLVGLEIVMKSHVWFLIARVDIVSGSSGYHRAMIIDRAFANLGEWWLIGTKSTAGWADESQHVWDVANQYIGYGIDGGLITLLLFILIIVRCFRAVGLTVHALGEETLSQQFCVWALGAALFSHVVSFLSVSYFDQNVLNWYLLLASISTASLSISSVRAKQSAQVLPATRNLSVPLLSSQL